MEEKNQPEEFPEEKQTTSSGEADVSQVRLFGILGYIFPFLFFLPLVTDAKDNAFAKYHANQQLLLVVILDYWEYGCQHFNGYTDRYFVVPGCLDFWTGMHGSRHYECCERP